MLPIKRSSTRGKTWKENSTSHQTGAALSQQHLKEKMGTKGTKFSSGEILSDSSINKLLKVLERHDDHREHPLLPPRSEDGRHRHPPMDRDTC